MKIFKLKNCLIKKNGRLKNLNEENFGKDKKKK